MVMVELVVQGLDKVLKVVVEAVPEVVPEVLEAVLAAAARRTSGTSL